MKTLFLLFFIFQISLNCLPQGFKPMASIYGGAGSFMLQTGSEIGAEYERVSAHVDVTYYIQGQFSYTAKAGVKFFYLDTYENETLSIHAGYSRYTAIDDNGKTLRQHPYFALRWTCYNVVSDIGYKDGGVFFTVGWQIRKINR